MSACVRTLHMDTVVSVSDYLLFPSLNEYKDKTSYSVHLIYGSSNIFPPDIFPAGILNDDGTLNNDASCLRLAEVAVSYARAGKSCYLKLVSV